MDREALAEVARTLQSELKRVPGTRGIDLIGAPERAVLVIPDAARLASHGLTLSELGGALAAANAVAEPGPRVSAKGSVPVTVGTWFASADEVAELVIATPAGRTLRVTDVAEVQRAPELVRKLRLEWMFRLWLEPRRLWRRYVVGNPIFLLRVLRQRLTGRKVA